MVPQDFGRKNNLARVVGEVFGDVADGLQPGHAEPLDKVLPREVARRQTPESGIPLRDRLEGE